MTQQEEQEAKQHLLCHFSVSYHHRSSPFLNLLIDYVLKNALKIENYYL